MRASLIVVLATFLCVGCAIIPEQVEVGYTPDPGVARTAIVAPTPISLQVVDTRRAEGPAWIADKKNSYGMRLASVLAQRPVVDLVRDALAQELTARGIQVGHGSSIVSVDVSRLESVYQNRFFSIGAIGYADLSVQVRRADGSIAYARTFSVSDDTEAGLAGTAGQARRSVERVLSKVVGQILSDPAFTAALMAARTAADPTVPGRV